MITQTFISLSSFVKLPKFYPMFNQISLIKFIAQKYSTIYYKQAHESFKRVIHFRLFCLESYTISLSNKLKQC